mgnify:CR=1 FL=1
MATIVHKTVDGYGPYAYRVHYLGGGKQKWEWLGKVGQSTPPEGPVTNDVEPPVTDDTGGVTQPGESPAAAEHDREYHEDKLSWILGDETFADADDYYDDKPRTKWLADEISKHYQTEHDIRVALLDASSKAQLQAIVADIEEAREAGLLDGIVKIGDATNEQLQERHGTESVITAEYEPEPRDPVGNRMGYHPQLTINADAYRVDGENPGVQSYGAEYDDQRHAFWHEIGHHQHLDAYHEERVDVHEVMNAAEGGVWDEMHAAMDGYRDAITEEFDRSVSHDPIEFYADAWARDFAGEELPDEIVSAMEAVEAEQILNNE